MNDPWTFTDTITVYNWEDHPEWDLCPINTDGDWHDQIKYYYRNKKCIFMVECKRILKNYECIEWDNVAKRNIFKPSELWNKNKFYPVKLSKIAENLYEFNIDYPKPILTNSVSMPTNKQNINIHGVWKIYYLGGSDTGSMYVDSIDIFKNKVNKCHDFALMRFPSVNIHVPSMLINAGVMYDNISNYKICN